MLHLRLLDVYTSGKPIHFTYEKVRNNAFQKSKKCNLQTFGMVLAVKNPSRWRT